MLYLENMNLHVINSPNNPDTACHFQPYSFYLGGKRTYWGLPNNPDYDLGPLPGFPCSAAGIEEENGEEKQLLIAPNPAKTSTVITAKKFIKSVLTLYDITGRPLLQQAFNGKAIIDLYRLSKGVYIGELKDKNGKTIVGKIIKE